jgi:hypothetical protein
MPGWRHGGRLAGAWDGWMKGSVLDANGRPCPVQLGASPARVSEVYYAFSNDEAPYGFSNAHI